MTFTRAVITAGMAAAFSHCTQSSEVIGATFVGWAAWVLFTSDPLPGAIERGLEAFRWKYQR